MPPENPVKIRSSHVVERFVGQLLLQLAVHGPDVDEKLIGSIGTHVRSQVADRGRVRYEVRNLDVEVVAEQPEQHLLMQAIARGSLPNAVKTKSCSGTTASTATPPGDDPEMQSTVVVPNGMSTHARPER